MEAGDYGVGRDTRAQESVSALFLGLINSRLDDEASPILWDSNVIQLLVPGG
jgi:hypothetical protein